MTLGTMPTAGIIPLYQAHIRHHRHTRYHPPATHQVRTAHLGHIAPNTGRTPGTVPKGHVTGSPADTPGITPPLYLTRGTTDTPRAPAQLGQKGVRGQSTGKSGSQARLLGPSLTAPLRTPDTQAVLRGPRRNC